jgi:predicted MFS family arabinose efflux permease
VVLTHFVGAILVKYKPDGNPVGYGALFAFAFLLAIASTLLLSRVPDVKKQQLPEARQRVGPIFEPLSSPAFRRLFVGAAVFNGSVQLAGPYFPYYFTRELGISMSEIAIWGALTGLGSVLTAGFWGRSIDRTREPADIMRFSAFMIALSPLAYLVTSGDIVRWYGPVEYFVNGFAWAGYQVAFSALLFRVCPPERSMVYFSLFTAFSGFCAGVGAFLGGKLAIWLGDYGGFRTLWCLTAALRLSVVFFLLSRLPRFTAASFWGNLSLWHVRRL